MLKIPSSITQSNKSNEGRSGDNRDTTETVITFEKALVQFHKG